MPVQKSVIIYFFLLNARVVRIVNAQIVIYLICSIRIININLFRSFPLHYSIKRSLSLRDTPSIFFVHSPVNQFGILIRGKLSSWSQQQHEFWNANCICLLARLLSARLTGWLAGWLVNAVVFYFILFNESIYMAIQARNIGNFGQIEVVYLKSWMRCTDCY